MIDLGEDFSFVKVVLGGAELDLDAFGVCNRLSELHARHEGSADDFLAAVCEYLKELGFPPAGKGMADRFADKMFAHVQAVRERIKKNDTSSTAAGSPASTGSTPSA